MLLLNELVNEEHNNQNSEEIIMMGDVPTSVIITGFYSEHGNIPVH